MKRSGDKIVHVQLNEPYRGKSHYYFGSVTAIYDTLPADVVGITKESLWNALSSGEYEGKRATIRKDTIIRKNTNRQSPQRSENRPEERQYKED